MEPRIEDLEIRMAFLEKTIGELDGVLRELADTVDAMQTELTGIRAAMARDVETSKDLAEEKPPHW